nr:hypothetical protein [Tanacetum cinerariifolium]
MERDRALTKLQRKLNLAKTKKEGIQLNVNKLENVSKSLNKIIECQIVDNCKKRLGYNAVLPPHTGLFLPPKSDLSSTGLEELFNETKTEKSTDKSNDVEPESVRKNSDAPIIEDWVLDNEEETVEKQEVKPSINRINFVKAKTDNNPRKTVQNGEKSKQNTHRKREQKVLKPVWNNSQRVSHKNHSNAKGNHIRQATLNVNATRPFNVVHPKRIMNVVNQESYFSKQAHSFVQRPNQKLTTLKNSYANKKVKTVWVKKVNTTKPKAAVNAAKAKAKHNDVKGKRGNVVKASSCWAWKPKHNVLDHVSRYSNASITINKFDYGNLQEHLQDKRAIDSGCSRHMIWNMSFLTDYKEINRGYIAFGGNPKGGKIIGKGTKDETSSTLKSFITRVENLMNLRVKVIRCDNGTELKNREMNQFCEVKGIMRQYSVAMTPQQNKVAKKRNRTLIEAARTMLAYSKMPTTFWAEAVNTACYVQNRVDENLSKENKCNDQREEDNTNSTNRVNTVTSNINVASSSRVKVVGTNISIDLPLDLNMPLLKDIGIFKDSHDDEDVFGTKADFYNLDSTFQVSPIPTTRIHKDHPIEQVIGDLHSTPQIRRMSKNLEEHGLVGTVIPRTDNKHLQNYLFACFLSQLEPKKEQGKASSSGAYIGRGFSDVKKVSTLMETSKPLLKDEDGEEVDVHMYRSMIGSLMYLTSSRPDIMFDTVVANSTTEAEYVVASSCYGQIRTINDDVQLQALIDGKKVVINEASIRHDLKLNDAEDTSCLSNAVIFEELAKIGYEKPSEKLTFYKDFFLPQWKFFIHTIIQCLSAKTTSWNEFSSIMASAIICLANNQKFNFSKYILDYLKKNLEVGVPFYMFLRFIQVFVNHQLGAMSHHKGIFVKPSLTKKVFANLKKVVTWFSGAVTPLFGIMMVQAVEKVGNLPTDVQDAPIPNAPSSSQHQRKHKPRRKERKETKVSPTEIHTKDHVPTTSNDPLPSEMKSYHKAKMAELEIRVEKLEDENRSLTKELKSFNTRVESLAIKETVVNKEESSKQGRKITDIDADVEVNLENVYNLDMAHEEIVLSMQDVDVQSKRIDADVKEVTKEMVEVMEIAKIIIDEVSTAGGELNAVNENPVSAALTNITIAQPSEATKTTVDITTAPKVKGKVFHDKEDSTTRTTSLKSQDNTEKQKLEEQQEAKELKNNLEIVSDDEDNYLQHEHYALWEVIEFGYSYEFPQQETAIGSASESATKKKGRTIAVTTGDMQKRRNDVKARTTLLLALPDEHQLRFSKYKTAQELWAAILKTFGGNEATKKTKKNLLKQQYGNFKADCSETLEQTFNRLQVIVSQLEFMDIEIEQDDLNQKFLTRMAHAHNCVEKQNSGNGEVNTASIPTASTQVSPAGPNVTTASISLDTACAYIASQSNRSQIKYKDINQIDEDDIEEMDIKWNMALLSMRMGHFARECMVPRSQEWGRRENYRQEENHALVVDEEALTEFALMAKSSFDNETGLLEFADDTITDYSRPSSAIESNSDDLQNINPSITETGASSSTISSKPVIKFVKAVDRPTEIKKNKVETVKKLAVKYAKLYRKTSKSANACFNCGDFDHLSYDYGKWVEQRKSRLNNNHTHKSMPPGTRPNMNDARPKRTSFYKPSHSYDSRPFQIKSAVRTQARVLRVFTVNRKFLTINRKFLTGNSQNNIDDKGYWDSGCSRHMTGNISYLSDYEPFDGGYVSFGQGGCKITDKGTIKTGRNFKLTDDTNVLLRTPKQHNMYSIDLNNVVPHKDLSCLVDKASADEWKFEAKGDEDFFIRYSMSSKAFRVFNKRTKRVEENLHVEFLENKLIEKGARPNWLFDIDILTNSINYVLVVSAGTTSTNFSGTKEDASQDVKKDVSSLRYIALPNWFYEAHLETFTSNAQDGCKADAPESSENSNPTATSTNPPADQTKTLAVETPIPIVSSPVPTASLDDSPQLSSDTRLISKRVTSQDDTPSLDNILTLINRFKDILEVTTDTGDTNRVEADLSNMENNISASPTPTFKIHKDHLTSQIIGPVDTLEEPKKISDAFKDPSWVEAMQAELLQFKIQNIWSLVDCPEGMDVKNAFLYGTIDEEVYVMQPPGFQDLEFPARVYKVEKSMYGLHQAPRAWYDVKSANTPMDKENPWGKDETGKDIDLYLYRSMIGSLMYHTASRPDIMFAVYACARYQGIWYPKDSPFDLVAYSDNDYSGATQDRKSTTGGCQFLGRRLISWQYKKQTIVATSTTEAEYVAAASGYGQVLHHSIRDCFEKKLISVDHIHTDDNVADLLTKPFGAGRFQYLVFWSTARIKTTDEGIKILATVDGKPKTIFESSIRRNLKLRDEVGISSLPDAELFENLTLMGQYTRRARIAQSSALLTVADKPTSPLGDDIQGEACLTVSSFEAEQDRANIIKTSTLPSDSTPRVTSLAADEGSMQHKLNELTNLIKLPEDRDGGGDDLSGEDATIKGRSLETGEEAEVATVSVSPAGEIPTISVPTGSGMVPTASLIVVPTASPIFTTATVATPTQEGKLEEEMERDAQRMNEQIARDAEIARIHEEEKLQIMIDGLDRNNETVAKYLQEYEQFVVDLSIRERIELINDLVKYPDNYAKTKHFKGMSLEEIREKFVLVWKQIEDFVPIGSKEEGERFKRKGLTLEQDSAKKAKTSEEVSEEELKEMMQLVPVEEVYVEALQGRFESAMGISERDSEHQASYNDGNDKVIMWYQEPRFGLEFSLVDSRMIPEPGDANREVNVTETFHLQTDDELSEKELKQIEANDQAIQTILLSLLEDIYAVVDSCETAQEIWLQVQQMMKGSDIGIQEKKAKLFNEWERFTSNEGESIESYYHRFLKLMTDLKRNKHFPEKIASNLKFLNNLQPKWSRHVTIVHQTKDLHTADYT